MNHVLTTTSGAFGETLAAGINTGIRFLAIFSERTKLNVQYRKTVRELSKLTARELHDLGLSHASIRSVAYKAVYG